MGTPRTVIVAGAGVGGLTASLALAARGFRVIVLERAKRLEEVGAGLQLSPNASRILIDLGIAPLLTPHAIVPEAVSIISARSGQEIGHIPLGDAATRHYGAPYWIVHRADLQAALIAKVHAQPEIDLRLGWPVDNISISSDGVAVTSSGPAPQQEQAFALIGADGVRSAVRSQIFPALSPSFTGRIAWRGTIEAAQGPVEANPRNVQLWMGTNAHIVTYPISGSKRINVVAIVSGTWNEPGWNVTGNATEVAGYFSEARWPTAARALIGAVSEWRKWALFGMPDGGAWNTGAVAFLGDAAHAMLPFAAQGAGMAIEDAAVLAQCLHESPDTPAAAFARYAALRAPRVTRVQRLARKNGTISHLGGISAFARDWVTKGLGGARLRARQDWIYDWRLQ